MTIRRLLALALLAGAPKIAAAQFTTFIPPKPAVTDSVKAAVVVQQKVTADSIQHAQITNMKTWVDSAAGLAPVPIADSTVALATTTNPAVLPDTAFRNGMRAPATASELPLLLVLGGLLIVAGGMIMTREPKPARASAHRSRA